MDFAKTVRSAIGDEITSHEMIELGDFINAEELYLAAFVDARQRLSQWIAKEVAEEEGALMLHYIILQVGVDYRSEGVALAETTINSKELRNVS